MTVVHATFLLDRLYRGEALLTRADAATSVIEEARVASRRQLVWMLGAVPFGLLRAAFTLAQVRRIGERAERIARTARRMVEGDVEPSPVDPADRAERNPVLHAAACALELRTAVAKMCDGWSIRIGIHVSAVTAGLLGRKRFQYDVWGDTVDLAARLHHTTGRARSC